MKTIYTLLINFFIKKSKGLLTLTNIIKNKDFLIGKEITKRNNKKFNSGKFVEIITDVIISKSNNNQNRHMFILSNGYKIYGGKCNFLQKSFKKYISTY